MIVDPKTGMLSEEQKTLTELAYEVVRGCCRQEAQRRIDRMYADFRNLDTLCGGTPFYDCQVAVRNCLVVGIVRGEI